MNLKLYNTANRKIENFASIEDGKVKIYTCGPTVYDELHVGNWAAYIYWDVLVRTLRANGLAVEQTINITDVGHLTDDGDEGADKLEAGAERESCTAWDLAKRYTQSFIDGRVALNIDPPTHLPRATDYIQNQLDLILDLHNKGFIYQISDGLYFDTSKFNHYKDFAGLDLGSLKAGARTTFNTEKRNLSDFAVWKFSPKDKKRDMEWETPSELLQKPTADIVYGFPGWHIECSAIALSTLGETLDIHTGGIDHIPVHHTNEIAQSESATGKKLSNYWLHNNHMKSNGTKISKSLQNGYTLKQIEDAGFSPMEYRLFVLQSHYRSESNFSFENLTSAANRLKNWRQIACLRHQTYATINQDEDSKIYFHTEPHQLLEIMNDDLNTPEALSLIDRSFNRIHNSHSKNIDQASFSRWLEDIDQILGLTLIKDTPDINDEQKALLLERKNARTNKDWSTSDKLRDQLLQQGIEVNDTENTSYWHYAF